jgi:hypothetical protein
LRVVNVGFELMAMTVDCRMLWIRQINAFLSAGDEAVLSGDLRASCYVKAVPKRKDKK